MIPICKKLAWGIQRKSLVFRSAPSLLPPLTRQKSSLESPARTLAVVSHDDDAAATAPSVVKQRPLELSPGQTWQASAKDIRYGRWLFAGSVTRCALSSLAELREWRLGEAALLAKEALPEVALWGQSNVGKSSLLNALLGSDVAKVSSRPGMTAGVHVHELRQLVRLVDLPGLGYASLPLPQRRRLSALLSAYVQGGPPLRLLLVLVDARRVGEVPPPWEEELRWCGGRPFVLVVTKSDKVAPPLLLLHERTLVALLAQHPLAHPQPLFTSAHTRTGLDAIRVLVVQSLLPSLPSAASSPSPSPWSRARGSLLAKASSSSSSSSSSWSF